MLTYALLKRGALLSCVALGACAPDDQGEVSESLSASTDVWTGPSVPCGAATSDAQFYSFTAALPAVNGTLLKCEKLANQPTSGTGYRVLYKTSTLVHNNGVASELGLVASGQIFVPSVAATRPDGSVIAPDATGRTDRPVIADTHGATGVLVACGPSRTPSSHDGAPGYFDKVVTGAVSVEPDYVGLGMDHGYRVAEAGYQVTWPNFVKSTPFSNITHPFASIESEARSTVDLVRAARDLAGLTANPRWFVVGQSQGGHAALATTEVVARGYGSELRLLGAVAGAPATELDNPGWWAAEFKNAVFGMMTASLPLEWRDIRATKYLSYGGLLAIDNVSNRLCFNQNTLLETLAKYDVVNPMFSVNPWSDSSVLAALSYNSPGRSTINVPVFVGQVVGDPLIQYQRTESFVQKARLTNPGKYTYCEYKGSADPSLPALLRAENHNAFGPMFSGAPAAYGCTLPDGTPTQADPVSFVSSLYRAAF